MKQLYEFFSYPDTSVFVFADSIEDAEKQLLEESNGEPLVGQLFKVEEQTARIDWTEPESGFFKAQRIKEYDKKMV